MLNNRKSNQKKKAYYDKKANERKFEVNDKVYLFCPARKPGRCHKFRSFWQGPFMVAQKMSDLNYKIVDKKGREFVVHINRLTLEAPVVLHYLKAPTAVKLTAVCFIAF